MRPSRFPVTTALGAGRLLEFLIVGGLLLACGGASSPEPGAAAPTPSTPAPPVPTTTAEVVAEHPLTTTAAVVTAETVPAGSSLVGQAADAVEVFEGPELAAPSYVLESATLLGSPRVFLIETGPVDGWVEVSLPIRPNGSTGWVRAGALDLEVVDYAIFVDLSERRLRLEQGEEVVLETEVAIGSPHNPTPTGSYFVTDIVQLADPGGPWGPFALGLSAFSDTITEFNGGDGIIGIHGTNRPASIGEPVSLGCVRVPNEIAAQLAELVKLGTPVEIEA